MQNENGRLRIHTSVRPVQEGRTQIKEEAAEMQSEKDRQEPLPNSGRRKKTHSRSENKKRERSERLTMSERLLRNAAVSCALLLTVMALRNIDQPWSRQATEGIRQAMTMRIDWDDTLGKLSFVRALVPDTALVFLNMDAEEKLCAPVNGAVSHEYTEQQPWMEYSCQADQIVCAAMTGTVTAVGQGAGGDWTVLIEDGRGAETVYGYLADVYVQAGRQVEAGDAIGATAAHADGRMYFEFREEGMPADPSARLR